MLRAIPYALAALGLALGLFLDNGLAALLPCDPWPAPFASGFGGPIGGAIGAVVGLAAARASRGLASTGKALQILASGVGFVAAVTVVTGGLGYASGQRDAAERDLAALREVRRDIAKDLIDREKGEREAAELEASAAQRRDNPRAFRSARQAAGIGAAVAATLAGIFVCLALQYMVLRERVAAQE